MKLKNICFLLILFLLSFPLSSYSIEKKPLVVASTEDLAAIAGAIGGDAINVEFLAPGKADAHLIEVKPSYAIRLMKADAVIVVGLALDRWMFRLIDNSRNRRIRPGTDGFIDASEPCNIRDRNRNINRSMGDVHPQGNPHYLLNPANGILVAQQLTERFSRLFPEYEREFNSNLRRFEEETENMKRSLEPYIEKIRGVKVITYHKNWDYFAEFTGIDILAEIEPKPGIRPTGRHTRKVVDKMNSAGVEIIIRAPFYEARTPAKIADDTGAEVLTLAPQVGALSNVKDYWDLFEYNIRQIAGAVDAGN